MLAERLVVAGDLVSATVMRYSPDTPLGGVSGPWRSHAGRGMAWADFEEQNIRGPSPSWSEAAGGSR